MQLEGKKNLRNRCPHSGVERVRARVKIKIIKNNFIKITSYCTSWIMYQQCTNLTTTCHIVVSRTKKRKNAVSTRFFPQPVFEPEDVHKSLRSTANAIQSYAFEGKQEHNSIGSLGSSPLNANNSNNNGSTGKVDDLPSLVDKMSLLDMDPGKTQPDSGPPSGGTTDGNSPRGNHVTKISIENLNKGTFSHIFLSSIYSFSKHTVVASKQFRVWALAARFLQSALGRRAGRACQHASNSKSFIVSLPSNLQWLWLIWIRTISK